MTNENAVDVRDCVEWTSWEDADNDAGFTHAWSVLRLGWRCHQGNEDKRTDYTNHFNLFDFFSEPPLRSLCLCSEFCCELVNHGFASKVGNHTWTGSVQGAVATWSNHVSQQSLGNV